MLMYVTVPITITTTIASRPTVVSMAVPVVMVVVVVVFVFVVVVVVVAVAVDMFPTRSTASAFVLHQKMFDFTNAARCQDKGCVVFNAFRLSQVRRLQMMTSSIQSARQHVTR